MIHRSSFRTAVLLLAAAPLLWACSDPVTSPSAGPPAGSVPRLTVTPTNAFSAIDAGQTHSCGLTAAGQAWCWGRNAAGQLGDSTAATTTVPVSVHQPAGVAFMQITSGAIHNCALDSSGQAYCWGYNADGRLGDSTLVNPLIPVAVLPLGGVAFTTLSAGTAHTCGLNASGQGYCWGSNSSGQIGDSSAIGPATPGAVHQPAGVVFSSISAGGTHTCALASTGQAYCWGYGGDGALGNNSFLGSRVPVAVQQGGLSFTAVVTEYSHTCALTSVGQAYCWGRNDSGQLGDSTLTNRKVPTAVLQPGGVTFVSLATGSSYTCGLTAAGQAYCWGNNQFGSLGTANTTAYRTPTAVAQPAGVIFSDVRTGSGHTCALDTNGQTWCWGRNQYSQMGDGTTTTRTSPVAVSH
ncbi:MAG TPA: hypothetical protein VFE05_21495 [Longimicrobiaceae bacterium]|jgi:alpha-tubulin suppressor-like RCC1 family protein|nr:hypothetical protein [Longimicrobiaceae bacterium]